METLYEETYFFTVSRDEETDDHFLEVLCGTSAVYMIRIKLNEKEIAEYRRNRESARILAYKISDSPGSFQHRRI